MGDLCVVAGRRAMSQQQQRAQCSVTQSKTVKDSDTCNLHWPTPTQWLDTLRHIQRLLLLAARLVCQVSLYQLTFLSSGGGAVIDGWPFIYCFRISFGCFHNRISDRKFDIRISGYRLTSLAASEKACRARSVCVLGTVSSGASDDRSGP